MKRKRPAPAISGEDASALGAFFDAGHAKQRKGTPTALKVSREDAEALQDFFEAGPSSDGAAASSSSAGLAEEAAAPPGAWKSKKGLSTLTPASRSRALKMIQDSIGDWVSSGEDASWLLDALFHSYTKSYPDVQVPTSCRESACRCSGLFQALGHLREQPAVQQHRPALVGLDHAVRSVASCRSANALSSHFVPGTEESGFTRSGAAAYYMCIHIHIIHICRGMDLLRRAGRPKKFTPTAVARDTQIA